MEQRLILVNLLIKLGVAAAVSSALVRSKEFKKLLFLEEREVRHKIYLALWMAVPIALGVWIRFSARNFLAGDLALETTVLSSITLRSRFRRIWFDMYSSNSGIVISC